MPGDFPEELSNTPCTLHDLTTGDVVAFGRMNLRFVEHTDRLRVMRFRFTGEFKPDTPEDKATLDRLLIGGFSAGAAGHRMQVEQGDRTWALVVKLEPGDVVYPFTGRNDPKPVL